MNRILYILFFLVSVIAHPQLDRSVMPAPGPAPEINLGKASSFELRNGLKVLVVENGKLPRVSAQLTLDNPPVREGEKAGISSLMGSLLGNGSQSISKDDFHEEVDFLGSQLVFGSQSAFAGSLSKYFPRILELMADAAIHPNFTQNEFEKEKAKLITAIRAQEKDVSAIASRVQYALAYGTAHPYGEFMTEESINRIHLEDVKDFYRNYFVPENAYLVVVGDISFKEVRKLVNRHFKEWPAATAPLTEYKRPAAVPQTRLGFVDMPNAVQSEVIVQSLTDLKMKDPDYLHALLANRILGGGAQSRLFLNLREDKAYTYGAYSGLEHDKYEPALFSASASVRNSVADSALVQLLEEVDRIIREPVSPEELKDAKAKYVGNFVIALEKPETVARYALNIETEGLPLDFYTTYLERMNAITVEEVQKAAGKYFSSENAILVVTGNGSEVLKKLEGFTFKGKSIPLAYYDANARQVAKPDPKVALPEGITLASIIAVYFKAIGGAEAVARINSLKLVYEGSAMGATIRTEELRTRDDFAFTTFMNDAPIIGVIARGDELFMKQGGTNTPLPDTMLADFRNSRGVFPEQGMLTNPSARLAGLEEVSGRNAYKIEVPGRSIQATYYYDQETGLKIKENIVLDFNGQTQHQEVIYKEYEDIEGIKIPGLRFGTLGTEQLEYRLVEAKVNLEFSEEDFQ